jgi:hypothetical protein
MYDDDKAALFQRNSRGQQFVILATMAVADMAVSHELLARSF